MQVQITIRGRQYTVKSDDDGQDIRDVANELDGRLADVAGRTRSFDEYTVALLTALNLASENRRLRRQVAARLDEFDREAASIAAMLDASLDRRDGRDSE